MKFIVDKGTMLRVNYRYQQTSANNPLGSPYKNNNPFPGKAEWDGESLAWIVDLQTMNDMYQLFIGEECNLVVNFFSIHHEADQIKQGLSGRITVADTHLGM